jgi:acetolactate synthase-1/3 small subunit
MRDAHTVSVLLDDGLLTLNRAVGALRRRHVPVARYALGPAGAGQARLTVVLRADAATADRVARQMAKVVGVHAAAVLPGDDGAADELALIRVREPGGLRAELWRTVARYPATVIREDVDGVVVRVSGAARTVRAVEDALVPFGILEVARSGPVALGAADPARAFTPTEVAS